MQSEVQTPESAKAEYNYIYYNINNELKSGRLICYSFENNHKNIKFTVESNQNDMQNYYMNSENIILMSKNDKEIKENKFIEIGAVIIAILIGILIFAIKVKIEIYIKIRKAVLTIGACLFVMFFNLSSLLNIWPILVDDLINPMFKSKPSIFINSIILILLIALTTAGALKIASEKGLDEINKEYPEKSIQKDKTSNQKNNC